MRERGTKAHTDTAHSPYRHTRSYHCHTVTLLTHSHTHPPPCTRTHKHTQRRHSPRNTLRDKPHTTAGCAGTFRSYHGHTVDTVTPSHSFVPGRSHSHSYVHCTFVVFLVTHPLTHSGHAGHTHIRLTPTLHAGHTLTLPRLSLTLSLIRAMQYCIASCTPTKIQSLPTSSASLTGSISLSTCVTYKKRTKTVSVMRVTGYGIAL